jgi:hypothetical protein
MKNEASEVMDGELIAVKVHYIDSDGIGRRYKTVRRRASRYRREYAEPRIETVSVRIDGRDLRAIRYSNTVWMAEITTNA